LFGLQASSPKVHEHVQAFQVKLAERDEELEKCKYELAEKDRIIENMRLEMERMKASLLTNGPAEAQITGRIVVEDAASTSYDDEN
jgi:hypothetical protein